MTLEKFLEDHTQYDEILMNNYKILNEINVPSKKKRFPYNILHLTVRPTYKSISLEYIKGKNFSEKKGGNNKIFIYLY